MLITALIQGNPRHQILCLVWCCPHVSEFEYTPLLASQSEYTPFCINQPLCTNMTSSTKLEVHNILQHHQRRTKPWPYITQKIAKLGRVASEICVQSAEKPTNRHDCHITPLLYCGRNKNTISGHPRCHTHTGAVHQFTWSVIHVKLLNVTSVKGRQSSYKEVTLQKVISKSLRTFWCYFTDWNAICYCVMLPLQAQSIGHLWHSVILRVQPLSHCFRFDTTKPVHVQAWHKPTVPRTTHWDRPINSLNMTQQVVGWLLAFWPQLTTAIQTTYNTHREIHNYVYNYTTTTTI